MNTLLLLPVSQGKINTEESGINWTGPTHLNFRDLGVETAATTPENQRKWGKKNLFARPGVSWLCTCIPASTQGVRRTEHSSNAAHLFEHLSRAGRKNNSRNANTVRSQKSPYIDTYTR
jgi:hypothetical protein